MKPGFRQAMTWLHNWSGLVIGWLLLGIAGAGTLSVFRQELDGWTHPELARGPVNQAEAGAAAARWLGLHAAKAPAWFLDPADARSPGTLAFWSDGRGFVQKTLSPLTGSPDGIRDSLGGEFFYRFHFELQLPYPWGRLFAAAAGMVLLTTLLTGIVAHRRIFKDFFTLRTGKGQRSWLDGHVALGVLALPFHLMIAFTGVVTLAGLFMPWAGTAAFKGDAAALDAALFPAIERPASGRPAPLVPLAPLLRRAEARFGGAGIASVAIAHPGDAAQIVSVDAAEDAGIAVEQHSLFFDGTTGRLLAEHVERRPAVQTYDVLYGLHTGRFAGLVSRWLYFVSGLVLTAAIATGLVLWTAKRRRPHGVGHHLVERLNLSMIAGMPAAFATFLLANRLLPADLAARSALELRWTFVVWGAALLYAAVRGPARGWAELLAAVALLCLATIAADLATRPPFDGVTIGVDLVLLVAAAAFGAVAWYLRPRTARRIAGTVAA